MRSPTTCSSANSATAARSIPPSQSRLATQPDWRKWLLGSVPKLKKREQPKSTCERYRRKYPHLRLQAHGDDQLKHLFLGLDAKLSLRYFNQYRKAATDIQAATALADLFGKHRGTWYGSGWVRSAVANVVLGDRRAAEHFVRTYWDHVEAETPAQQQKAMEALCEFDHDRKTWLKMAKAVISAHKSDPANRDPRSLESRALDSKWFPADFAADDDYYPEGYAEELLVRGCRLLTALSTACIEEAPTSATELLDRAIASLHGTSHSTLTKLRASMKK